MRAAWGFGSLDARKVRALAAFALAAMMAAPPALAEPGTATLAARGPLSLEGPVELTGQQAGLVLRDPGTASWPRVQLDLHAAKARVEDIVIQESCLAPGAGRVASVQVTDFIPGEALPAPPLPGLPLPALPALPVPPAPPAAPAPPGAPPAAAPRLAGADADAVLAQRAAAGTAAPPARGDASQASCMELVPSSDEQVTELRNLTLSARPGDPAYLIAYQGTAPRAAGVVTLASLDGALDAVRGGDTVTPLPDSDTEFRASAPSEHYGSGLLRVGAASAVGGIAGRGEVLVYRAAASVAGTTADGQAFSKLYTTGETRSAGPIPGLGVQQRRTLEFLRVTFEDGAGTFRSPGQVAAYAARAAVRLDGTLGLPAAWGHVDVGNHTFVLDGAPARLSGALNFTVAKAERRAAPPGRSDDAPSPPPQLAVTLDGDVSRVETAHVAQSFPQLAQTAAAATGFALLAGALAYFWPAIKFGATALYTRIPRDAVLLHGARERMYRLVKDEPGIHAHEVAERLGLGWGTTVYHLKLLEKNQLLVARHEGRYKRFFATGDARIQHQEAIALLRNRTARAIAAQVAKRPGLIQKEVCRALEMSPSLASWHLQRLEAAGVVKAERWGRTVRYAPGPAWEELHAASGAGPGPALPDAPRVAQAPPSAVPAAPPRA